MAKGAANEKSLGGLHSALARVFTKVLEKYERNMSALDDIPADEIEAEMLNTLIEMQEPNPAMLGAISKFLKDNDIGMDSEDVDKLNDTERRLAESRAKRLKAGVNLAVVPLVKES